MKVFFNFIFVSFFKKILVFIGGDEFGDNVETILRDNNDYTFVFSFYVSPKKFELIQKVCFFRKKNPKKNRIFFFSVIN